MHYIELRRKDPESAVITKSTSMKKSKGHNVQTNQKQKKNKSDILKNKKKITSILDLIDRLIPTSPRTTTNPQTHK